MATVYVVKTGEQYLCTAEDGDVGLTPSKEEAGTYSSYEEAEKAAREHAGSDYEIIPIDR